MTFKIISIKFLMVKKHLLACLPLLLLFVNSYCQNFLSNEDSLLFRKIVTEFVSRDTIRTRMVTDRATGITTYETRDISPSTFDSLFKPVYGKVMLGNSDFVNQGSAYALSVDEFKSNFTINYNWAKDKNNFAGNYFNIGFAASSSSKFVPVFSKNQWQQGLSLNFGVTHGFKNVIFYNPGEDYREKRNRFLVLSLKKTREFLLLDTNITQRKIQNIDSIKLTWPASASIYDSIAALTVKGTQDLRSAQTDLENSRYIRSFDTNRNGLVKYVDSCYSAFEAAYFKKFYYSFWWFNIALQPEYKELSIYDTSAASIAAIKKKDYLRLGLQANINYARNAHNLFLVQFGVLIGNSNYLEGRKSDNIEFLKTSNLTDSITISKNNDALVISDYEKYKKQFALISTTAGFNWFWGEKRMFGWELFYSSKIATFKSKNIPFYNLFTVRTGFLFSINGKDNIAKSTFGLIAKWEDVTYKKANLKDVFTLGIRIGIPFNF